MASQIVLHLSRPYANAEEYLAREAWTIDTRTMLLVDQGELELETDIAFDVTLNDGSKPIRAEARVLEVVAPAEGRPGGTRVRFKRYGAATRAFVERAVSARWSSDSEPPPPRPGSVPPSARPPSMRPASVRPSQGPSALAPPLGMDPPSYAMDSPEEEKTMRFRAPGEVVAAALERRARAVVEPPPDRDLLLERLRQRAR